MVPGLLVSKRYERHSAIVVTRRIKIVFLFTDSPSKNCFMLKMLTTIDKNKRTYKFQVHFNGNNTKRRLASSYVKPSMQQQTILVR